MKFETGKLTITIAMAVRNPRTFVGRTGAAWNTSARGVPERWTVAVKQPRAPEPGSSIKQQFSSHFQFQFQFQLRPEPQQKQKQTQHQLEP